MRQRALALVALVALTAAAGCASGGGDGTGASDKTENVKIGFVGSLSGNGAAYGTAALNAAKLAIKEINAAGGVKRPNGAKAKLELVALDDRSETVGVNEAMQRLTSQEKVPVIMGGLTTGNAVVAGDLAERSKTPLLCFALGDSTTSRGFTYFFRVSAGTSRLANQAVNFAVEMTKKSGKTPTIGLLADDGAFSQDAAKAVKAALAAANLPIAEVVTYSAGSVSDFTQLLGRMTRKNVDLLFQAVTPQDGVAVTKTMKSINWAPAASIHVGGAAANAVYTGSLKADANLTFGAAGYVQELAEGLVPQLTEFSKRFEAEYKGPLDESSSSGAVIVGLIMDAIEKVDKVDAASVTQHLRKVDLNVGANFYIIRNGGVKFAANGDNSRAEPLVFQILDGKQKVVFPSTLGKTPPVWPAPAWGSR